MSESGHPPSYSQEPPKYVVSRHKLPSIAPPRPNSSYGSAVSITNNRTSHTSWMNERNHNCPESGVYCPTSIPRNYPPAARAHCHEEPSFSNVLKSSYEAIEVLTFPKNDVQLESMDLSSSHYDSPVKKLKSSLNGDPEKSNTIKPKSSPRKKSGVGIIAMNPPKPTRQTDSTTKLHKASPPSCVKPKLNSPKIKKPEGKAVVRSVSVPSDNVESALETLFHSETSVVSSAPSSTVIVSNPQDSEESVEKILNSPSPCENDILSNADAQNDCDDSKQSLKHNSIKNLGSVTTDDGISQQAETTEMTSDVMNGSKVVNYQNSTIDIIQKSNSEIREETKPSTSIVSPNKKVLIAASTDDASTTNKGKNEETTFVKVESELEKMFAGIDDNCPEKKENLQNISQTDKQSSNIQNSVFINPPSTSKTVRKKTAKKSKTATASSKNLKETKTKSSSTKDSSVVDSAFAKRIPVIHIEGSKENPISIQIINSIKSEEDDLQDGKTSAKRKFAKNDRAAKKLATSHVVKNYDPTNSDVSWICVFCKQCAYSIGLSGEPSGDLFGPYFITNPLEVGENESKKHSNKTNHNEQLKKKQKRSLSESTTSFDSSHCEKKKALEIWAHENCIVWASGIHLIGSKLIGLEEAVFEALETSCTHCNEKGASIGCRARHCKSCMHYSCAVYTGWNLNSETFITTCNIHRILN